VQRGYAVMHVTPTGHEVADAAPSSFAGPTN
jgi:hypothetical protein